MGLVRKRIPEPNAPELPTRSLESLVFSLTLEGPDQRRSAAAELGARKEGAAALSERLGQEPDRTVREMIVHALLAIGSPESARGVAPLLGSDDATLRNQVRELLLGLPGAETVAEVLFDSPDPSVRMTALELFALGRGADGADRVLAALRNETDINVCAHGVEQLAQTATARQVGALSELVERFPNEEFLRFAVDVALDSIRARPPDELSASYEES